MPYSSIKRHKHKDVEFAVYHADGVGDRQWRSYEVFEDALAAVGMGGLTGGRAMMLDVIPSSLGGALWLLGPHPTEEKRADMTRRYREAVERSDRAYSARERNGGKGGGPDLHPVVERYRFPAPSNETL